MVPCLSRATGAIRLDRRMPAQSPSQRESLGVTMEPMEPKPIAFEGHGAATGASPVEGTMTTHVTFATRAPGPLQDLTLRRPGLAIDAYPLGGLLLLRCLGNAEGIERSSELRDSGRQILYHAQSGEEITLLLDGGKDEEETIASLADENAHVVSPIRWQRGEALITMVLEDGTDPRALLERFPDARPQRPSKCIPSSAGNSVSTCSWRSSETEWPACGSHGRPQRRASVRIIHIWLGSWSTSARGTTTSRTFPSISRSDRSNARSSTSCVRSPPVERSPTGKLQGNSAGRGPAGPWAPPAPGTRRSS